MSPGSQNFPENVEALVVTEKPQYQKQRVRVTIEVMKTAPVLTV